VKVSPQLVIFDVDGVLVDVHGSFHRTIIDTVHHFTKHRPTYADIQIWKRQTGYNDDWRLSTDWVNQLGKKVEYAKVKRQFQRFYWGVNGQRGNVLRERWLVPRRRLERWAERAELALFTGRTRRELKFTLDRFEVAHLFRRVVTMDDVERLKPDPEGLHFLLDSKKPGEALYLGDNLDDALAAKNARMPFLGVLPRGSDARRMRGGQLRSHGAKLILDNANELERYWI
jgi:HAD superfamily hydrolase (TIGR01548 family)